MKTKEFIKRVEDLGYTIFSTNEPFIQIYDHRERILAEVSREKQYQININKDEHITKTLFDLIVEYASTPAEDREEEKRYYLKHRWLTEGGFYRYVKHHTKAYGKKYELASWTYGDTSDMQYTFKEIEEIKKKFDTDLSDFEMVEVEDEK